MNKGGGNSVNVCTPSKLCSVKYHDLDHTVSNCLKVSEYAIIKKGDKTVFVVKTDLSMAFRVLPLKKGCFLLACLKVSRDFYLYTFVTERVGKETRPVCQTLPPSH